MIIAVRKSGKQCGGASSAAGSRDDCYSEAVIEQRGTV